MNFNTAITEGQYMETGYAYSVESDERQMKSQSKIKKPGFIKRQLLKMLKDAVAGEQASQHLKERSLNSIRPMAIEKHSLDSQPMHLKIYRANGGTIVETTTYDRQKDRHGNQLHIISHDTDLGEGLSKIITMESLRG
jgi:hypothetical protein